MKKGVRKTLLTLSFLTASCGAVQQKPETLEQKVPHVTITQEDFNREADRLYRDGLYAYKRGANSRALRYFFDALKNNRNHPGANHKLGEWLLTKGSYEDAAEYVNKAIRNAENDSEKAFYEATLREIKRKQINPQHNH